MARLLLKLWGQKIDLLQTIVGIRKLGYRKIPELPVLSDEEVIRKAKELKWGSRTIEDMTALDTREIQRDADKKRMEG